MPPVVRGNVIPGIVARTNITYLGRMNRFLCLPSQILVRLLSACSVKLNLVRTERRFREGGAG